MTHCKQLKQRIYLHELDAGLVIDLFTRNNLANSLYHPIRACVPIMVGISDQAVKRVKKTVIHTPSIHANASQRIVVSSRDPQSILNLVPQAQNVPMDVISHAHGTVREAVDLLQRETLINTPQ